MNLVIFGATGGTGRALDEQALDRGHTVTAFVRKASRMRIKHGRLRLAIGDVLEYRAVEAAIAKQDAVLSALGHKRWVLKTSIFSEGTRNILAAMKKCGVSRFVCETSLGLGDSKVPPRDLLHVLPNSHSALFLFPGQRITREMDHAKWT